MKARHALGMFGIASVALWCASSLVAQAPLTAPSLLHVPGPVRVIQADTLEVAIGGTRRGVAIVGIKAPPGNTACGREATAAARQLVADSIWLDVDARVPEFAGRYRRLYRVTTAGGQLLATELALAGVVIAERAHVAAKDYADILAAETAARNAGRGCLWSGDSISAR